MRLFPLSSSSRSGLGDEQGDGEQKTRALLYLNVYDLTPVNNYLYWFGLGVFHSGIEVHGLEYGFGAHEYSSSGVFEVEPKSCPGFIFRRSVVLGSTDMSRSEFRSFMEHLSAKYHGDSYHLIAKNCNHFTDEVCLRLTGKPIPGWVNRLARLGSFCNCLLPESIQITAVRHLPDHPAYSGTAHNDRDLNPKIQFSNLMCWSWANLCVCVCGLRHCQNVMLMQMMMDQNLLHHLHQLRVKRRIQIIIF